MIAYRVLRGFGRLALRWFYRDVEVLGIERLPATGPVLLASNHPNALVDALVVGCTLRRPVTLTAKATLLENPVTRALLRAAGVVPLRRASDDIAKSASPRILDPSRNATAFAAVLDAFEHGRAVLLFPEGKSHSEPELAPLKTGLARMALMAREERHLDVPIVPVGLTFERKWEPRSRVLMQVGPEIRLQSTLPNADPVVALTERVNAGLREVTLNFATADDARRVLAMSTALAEVLDEFRPLHSPDPPLAESIRVARRISTIAPHLSRLEPAVASRIERFLERFNAFVALAQSNDVAPSDVRMRTSTGSGVWFVIRELSIAALVGPLAMWGRLNHWIPLRIARALALRRSRSPDEPAMNTIVAGLVLVLAFYVAQTSTIAWAFGWMAALTYAVSLPLSATWDFRYADRLRRAAARVRTYLKLRRDSDVHSQLLRELAWLRSEVTSLDAAVERALANTDIMAVPEPSTGQT
jgi:glycerol-3-phosphate O-acyltransferase / dihydroxyacetone phosphate acyltransferase